METRRKKKIMNIIMAVLAAAVIFCGIMAVGGIKGWFGNSDSAVVSSGTGGVVNIERSGVVYALDKKVAIEPGDMIETLNSSSAEFRVNKENEITMNESSQITFTNCDESTVALEVTAGEIIADMPEAPSEMTVGFGGNTAKITGTVFSVSVQSGSYGINVYEGNVAVTAADGSEYTVEAGNGLDIVQQSNGAYDIESKELTVESLNDFVIGKLKESKANLCFTADELNSVIEERESEVAEAENADGDTIKTDGNKADVMECTIQIRCETILSHMDSLTAGKDRYVPSNGIILATSTVEFTEGETVFDALKRVCSYAGIHLEYSWTPMYDSYYIEGINHLYEFDCGPQSGWMYKVNGWFPNYGCSGYELKDGDNIVWTYTCTGLGADVGGNVR